MVWAAVLFGAAGIAAAALSAGKPGWGTGYVFSEDARDGSYELADAASARTGSRPQISVQIQINAASELDREDGRCNLLIANPAENHMDLQVTVRLDATGEILYRSPVLKPGERLAYVVFEKVPEDGEHAATAEFHVLDPETGEAAGAVDAGIMIRVE